MNVILLGPPGAGKGTQAERLRDQRSLLHLSTGDLLRAAVREGSSLGQEARSFMDRGELVPDRLVLALLRERLEKARKEGDTRGFLLDGFPRNVAQAQALEGELGRNGVDHVVYLQLDDEEILGRLLKRGRPDDTEGVIRNRLEVYRGETEPLVSWYRDRGLLREVDALGTVDEIAGRVVVALDGQGGRASHGA